MLIFIGCLLSMGAYYPDSTVDYRVEQPVLCVHIHISLVLKFITLTPIDTKLSDSWVGVPEVAVDCKMALVKYESAVRDSVVTQWISVKVATQLLQRQKFVNPF